MKSDFTAKYEMRSMDGKYKFLFYCDYCRSGYTSDFIAALDKNHALFIAKKRARPYFNLCHKCGKWVCDSHYNENLMQCLVCAPKEIKKPASYLAK